MINETNFLSEIEIELYALQSSFRTFPKRSLTFLNSAFALQLIINFKITVSFLFLKKKKSLIDECITDVPDPSFF